MPNKRRNRTNYTGEQKEQLLRQVAEAESQGGTVTGYAREHGLSPTALTTMRRRYLRAHPDFDPSKPTKALTVRLEPVSNGGGKPKAGSDTANQMVREYLELGPGEKGPWLKEHGINHQDIHIMKKATLGPDVITHIISGEFVPPQLAATTPPTLADAILAMEVRRDQMNSFIEDLKRMLRGQR